MSSASLPVANIEKGRKMDLRMFYQKLRKIEQEIVDPHVVVVSNETPDGGRAGQKSEVSRNIAAKLVVEGKARLASVEEGTEYRSLIDQAIQAAEQRNLAQKIQVNVVSEADFRTIKSTPVRTDKK
jgi:uncharacterized Fe-S cluster-containing radical SAM superfamily enzyme